MSETAQKLILPSRQPCDGEEERTKILERVGDLSCFKEVMGNRILVAKWIRDKEGSFYTATSTKTEDKWQGKAGLVLLVGPQAYQEDETHDWAGQKVVPGDWVTFEYSSGHDFEFRPSHTFQTVYCKWLREGDIDAIVSRPDVAY